METKRLVKRSIIYKGGKECKDIEHVKLVQLVIIRREDTGNKPYLSNAKKLCCMIQAPVTQLVS